MKGRVLGGMVGVIVGAMVSTLISCNRPAAQPTQPVAETKAAAAPETKPTAAKNPEVQALLSRLRPLCADYRRENAAAKNDIQKRGLNRTYRTAAEKAVRGGTYARLHGIVEEVRPGIGTDRFWFRVTVDGFTFQTGIWDDAMLDPAHGIGKAASEFGKGDCIVISGKPDNFKPALFSLIGPPDDDIEGCWSAVVFKFSEILPCPQST